MGVADFVSMSMRAPMQVPADLDRYLAGLRKAGIA